LNVQGSNYEKEKKKELGCLGVVWMGGRGFFRPVFDVETVRGRSYKRGWLVLIR